MSGFVVMVDLDDRPIGRGLLERLTRCLAKRGPDASRIWIDGSVGMGHALFRTTEESAFERQPRSLDGSTWIAGNVRIDARAELVRRLGKGERIDLRTTPDSELVLRAYRAWGEAGLRYLQGDFAFALWDNRQRRLLCARDQFGMRQLYYSRVGRLLIVGNSLGCLRQHPHISNRLNDLAIGDFLLFGDSTWGDKSATAFADVRALLPAHLLLLSGETLAVRRYWDVPADVPLLRYRDECDYLDHFRSVFSCAVADRLRGGDVVVAMSGGLDSTAIAATAQRLRSETDASGSLNAVSVDFSPIHPSEERYYARMAADCLRLPIHFLSAQGYTLLNPFVATTRPIEDYLPALWLEFERKTSGLGRVMLNGEAGDNLLSYSPIMQTEHASGIGRWAMESVRLRLRYGRWPAVGTGLGRILRERTLPRRNSLVSRAAYPRWIAPEFEARLGLRGRWSQWQGWRPPNRHPRHPLVHEALVGPEWTSDDRYWQTDVLLAERRDPFLDLRVVEFVLSLPPLPWLFNKHLLRRAMEGELPRAIVQRPKALLGQLHQSLLKLPEPHWREGWQPHPDLAAYVDRRLVPPLADRRRHPASTYADLRPLILNRWLESASIRSS